jgi:hypothetical protein
MSVDFWCRKGASEACACWLQAYKYTQRPGPRLPPEEGGALEIEVPHSSKTVSGQPLTSGGRARNMVFPPFPQACPAVVGVKLQ